MDETFFVKIAEPDKLRVDILSSSKNSLESLRIQLKLQELHKQKVEAKKRLDDEFTQLTEFLSELTTLLPHQEVLEQVKKAKAKSAAKKKTSSTKKSSTDSKKKVAPKKHTELDKLNDALEEIEKRLSSLQ